MYEFLMYSHKYAQSRAIPYDEIAEITSLFLCLQEKEQTTLFLTDFFQPIEKIAFYTLEMRKISSSLRHEFTNMGPWGMGEQKMRNMNDKEAFSKALACLLFNFCLKSCSCFSSYAVCY